MEKLYDLNAEQLELITHLVNRWIIELSDTRQWAATELPEIMRQDMYNEIDKAENLALSVQGIFNDD